MSVTPAPARIPDVLTVACIAILAYITADISHEAVGHGGACMLVGCTPHPVTSMQFDGDSSQLPQSASRIIAAGGSVMNLIVAAVAAFLLGRTKLQHPGRWFFLWLLATVSLMQATGYLLYSGLGDIGDWTEVIAG